MSSRRLRLLADPADNAALLRLLTGPRWRLGPRDLVELGRRARHLERDGEDGGVQVSADPAATDHDRRLEEAVGGQDPTGRAVPRRGGREPGRRSLGRRHRAGAAAARRVAGAAPSTSGNRWWTW